MVECETEREEVVPMFKLHEHVCFCNTVNWDN